MLAGLERSGASAASCVWIGRRKAPSRNRLCPDVSNLETWLAVSVMDDPSITFPHGPLRNGFLTAFRRLPLAGPGPVPVMMPIAGWRDNTERWQLSGWDLQLRGGLL